MTDSIPTRLQAEQLLQEAEAANPGPWVPHSRFASLAAQHIAAHIPGMDAERAAIFGLLHDIGRIAGVSDMRHIVDGYRLMNERGYPGVARICMTHSFPLQDVNAMNGNWDGTPEGHDFVANYLEQVEYDDYDRLIQLCDGLALPQGICLIEKRMVDVAMRRGINEYTLAKWRATFAILQSFEEKIGCSIYAVLPGVVETTFGLQNS